jgi:penicillin G amidase
MRSLPRKLASLCVGVSAIVALALAMAGSVVWLTIPQDDMTVHIPGLRKPVRITLDDDGIPRVLADSERDGAVALGFLHARERLFQMDLMRRSASGRLSEIAGPATLRLDRMMRVLGLRRHAGADLAALPDETRQMLEAYASGVNAWINLKGRFAAPEFLFLGTPEPWQPIDSLLWAKTMGLWLSMNWRQELARLALSGEVSPTVLDQLWPRQSDAPGPQSWIAPKLGNIARRLLTDLPTFPDAFTLPQSASNEWAVDGTRTTTGAPLLAGDPHLAFGFPGIWYLARLDFPDHALVGATAPGIPFLVLGHNEKVAWTFTTTGADVQDVFVESPAGPGLYDTPAGPRRFEEREERIAIRGQQDEVLAVRETRHGPVISDIVQPDGPILAVAMGNLQEGDTAAAGLLALNRANSIGDAGIAAASITSPVQNLLVADRNAIALYVTGRVPIRRSGDGAAPAPGDGTHDWVGWAAGSELPRFIAPPSGRLVNANEPLSSSGSEIFMGRDGFGHWRSDRIRQMLDSSDRHRLEDFAAMQTDKVNLFAQHILPRLIETPIEGAIPNKAQALLREWDGTANTALPQPLIFNAWVAAFYDAVLQRAGLSSGLGTPTADFVSFVLSPEGRGWCDGDCRPLLQRSLTAAVANLRLRFGDDPSAWRWGSAHRATFSHPLLSNLPFLDQIGTISIDSAGDEDTVGRGGFDRNFRSVHGASFRGVYDLANLDRSLFMLAPGQSGNIFSPHSRDFITRWRDGATITIPPEMQHQSGLIELSP